MKRTEYFRLVMKMLKKKYVYIILSDTGTLFTNVIKAYTKAPYNHASLSCDRELREMYSFGRKNPNNPLTGGFVKEDILTGTFSKYRHTTCVIYRLQVTEREMEKMTRILEVFIKKNDKFFYNILG